MTTPRSCSTSTTVIPHSFLISRMKRTISSFSSMFMPAMGSSSSSSFGPRVRARATSTRFWTP